MRVKALGPHLSKIIRITAVVILFWSAVDVFYARRALHRQPPNNTNLLGSEKVFIASIHWNNEAILRSHWVSAVLDVAKSIGPDNVFVSVQESGSWDTSKELLSGLDVELGNANIRREIILDNTTHLDEISKAPAELGWVWTPREQMELRRIPYLARLRNLVLEPLSRLRESGEVFDKILLLSDVVFTSEDVERLLSTNCGDYATACSLDFSKAPLLYDTFALRDAEGHGPLALRWPMFRARASRRAMQANRPVHVESCWNGMVAMDAKPFYDDNLVFRGIPDSLASQHIEGSECCLVNVDNPYSKTKGVWINPRVRVGYNGPAYDGVNPHDGSWVSAWDIVIGSWENRLLRWLSTDWFENRIVKQRLLAWQQEDPIHVEKGSICLVNEMQVLQGNGWGHV